MGMNMTEKILARHAGLESVSAGQLITCKLDMVLANDITAPPSIKNSRKLAVRYLIRKNRIGSRSLSAVEGYQVGGAGQGSA